MLYVLEQTLRTLQYTEHPARYIHVQPNEDNGVTLCNYTEVISCWPKKPTVVKRRPPLVAKYIHLLASL